MFCEKVKLNQRCKGLTLRLNVGDDLMIDSLDPLKEVVHAARNKLLDRYASALIFEM
jgi:hypothetical protein